MVGLHAILIGPIIEFWFQWILHSESNVTELKKTYYQQEVKFNIWSPRDFIRNILHQVNFSIIFFPILQFLVQF